MKTATMLSMQRLTTVVTLGLFCLVTTQGLALEMVAALLVLSMEKQHFVDVSLYKLSANPCFNVVSLITHVHPPFVVPIVYELLLVPIVTCVILPGPST